MFLKVIGLFFLSVCTLFYFQGLIQSHIPVQISMVGMRYHLALGSVSLQGKASAIANIISVISHSCNL